MNPIPLPPPVSDYFHFNDCCLSTFPHSPQASCIVYAPLTMASAPRITYTQSPGPLGDLYATSGSSHTATIPAQASIVTISGQPGFNLQTGQLVTSSISDEIEACFDCVEAALKSAGVEKGLLETFKMTCYLLDVRLEPKMMEIWRRRVPGHKPVWITIGVAALAVPGMHIEMVAEAAIVL